MVEAWTTDFVSAVLFKLNDEGGQFWAYLDMFAADKYTEFTVVLGGAYFLTYSERVLFPLTWVRVCLSLETITGNVRLVVNGEVEEDKV